MKELSCILLVDDDPVANFINRRIVTSAISAVDIQEARNGQEALNFIRDFDKDEKCFPEIIFLDINMPVCNGFEFMEIVKEKYPEVASRVVVLSSSSKSSDISKMQSFGVRYFLTKPLTKDNVHQVLSTGVQQ